jgi:hypothetical protein
MVGRDESGRTGNISEIIDYSVFDTLHQFPPPLDLGVLYLLLLHHTDIGLVDAVLLQHYRLGRHWLHLLFGHLLLSLFLLFAAYLLSLL